MSPEYLGLILLVALITCIFIGFPIAFTLIILAIVFGYIGFGKVVFFLMFFQTWQIMKEETLAAVPLFIFMGHILEQAGLMERLFLSFQFILARVRGSLFLGVLFVSTIFATATGIIGASVTVMGLLAAPAMMRSRYNTALSAGVITAGGCLGILIPPSVLLVVLGPVVGVSVVQLFAAAIVPGLILSGLYFGYTFFRCQINPDLGPPLPPEEHPESFLGRDSRVLPGHRAARGCRVRRPGQHHRRTRDADRGGGHGGPGCPVAHGAVRTAELDHAARGDPEHAGHLQHGTVPGRSLEHLRLRICPSGHGDAHHRPIPCSACRCRRWP